MIQVREPEMGQVPYLGFDQDIQHVQRGREECCIHYEFSVRNLEHQFGHWHEGDQPGSMSKLILPCVVWYQSAAIDMQERVHAWLLSLHPPVITEPTVTSDMTVPYE